MSHSVETAERNDNFTAITDSVVKMIILNCTARLSETPDSISDAITSTPVKENLNCKTLASQRKLTRISDRDEDAVDAFESNY